MRRYLSLLLFIGLAFTQDKYVAVFNLENNGLKDSQVRTIRNRLESELKKTGLKVVEREQMNDLFKEQKLQLSGVVEDSLVRKIGSMLGASHILLGSVGKMDETYYTITAKLVDGSTGELIKTADYDALNGLPDLMKNGTKSIANTLFEIEIEDSSEPLQYIITIGNIFISNNDFNISNFGNPLNIGLVIWEDQKQHFKTSIGKVRGIQGINKKIKLKLKPNSVYKLYIGETDGIFTSNAVYEWVATWKGGKVEQRSTDWFFDNGRLRFGNKSYIEINQDPSYSDLRGGIFGDTGFKGAYLPLGDSVSKLGDKKFKEKGWSKNWNDRLSSVKVKKSYQVVLYEHSNYQGDSTVLKKDYPNLHEIGWGDRASSIKVKRISK